MALLNAGSASLKVKKDGAFEGPPANVTGYERPSDWLELPAVTDSEQKFVGLAAVYQDYPNWVSITCAGNYTVDWGDGSSPANFNANVTASKNLAWADYGSDTLSDRGYRQAIITVTPQSGQNLTRLDLDERPSNTGSGVWLAPWLDIRMAGSNLTTLDISGTGSAASWLEQFEFVGTNAVTDFSSCFSNARSLVKVVSLHTASGTNFSSMFLDCASLRELPSLDTSAGTDLKLMFNNCRSLREIPSISTAAVTAANLEGIFYGCSALVAIPLTSIGAATNLTNAFRECHSLQDIPALDVSAVTNFGNWVSGNRLKKVSATGFNASVSVASQQLQAAELNAIYTTASATGSGKTITVTSNPGTATDDPTIATAKGWTVSG